MAENLHRIDRHQTKNSQVARRHPGGLGTEQILSPLVRVFVSFEHACFTRGIKISIRWRSRVIWWATVPITFRSDLTCLTTYPSTPPERDTHPLLILASARTCSELPEEYKLVNMPARRTLVVLLCCGFNVLTFSVSLTSVGMGLSPSGFSFSFFFF